MINPETNPADENAIIQMAQQIQHSRQIQRRNQIISDRELQYAIFQKTHRIDIEQYRELSIQISKLEEQRRKIENCFATEYLKLAQTCEPLCQTVGHCFTYYKHMTGKEARNERCRFCLVSED